MAKRIRARLTLPDGSTAKASQPGQGRRVLEEHRLSDELAKQVDGVIELVLPYGRAEVATSTTVWEVERVSNWRDGVRQVLAYSVQSQLSPALGLFGVAPRAHVLDVYLRLRDGSPPIALWWYKHGRWVQITSRRACTEVRQFSPADALS